MVRAAVWCAPALRWKRTGSFHLVVAPKPREDWVLAIVLVRGDVVVIVERNGDVA